MFVPVVNQKQEPLMPTTCSRAARWIKSGKATGFFKKGLFCVRLNRKPSDNRRQQIAVGIDPGSKREAYTVKSESHTYLNVLSETPGWVKDAVEKRRNARRARRQRNTPCRKNKHNRSRSPFPPSTKSRWQLKLRICSWLKQLFPVSAFVVEDIKARTWKGAKKWNKSFSPLEVGKKWFYHELSVLASVQTRQGYETKELRDVLGLKKSSSKMSDKFECHNVDSWVLANSVVGGHIKVDNKSMLKLVPFQFHRRQLHVFQPASGDKRRKYGGTRSLGLKRGSLIIHTKYGLSYVGGSMKERVSLHCLETGKRLTQSAKVYDCVFKAYCSWRSFNIV